MAFQQPMGNTHADMIRRRAQLNDEYNRLSRERGEDDPEVQDLGSQIADITQRLQTISRQTVTQASDRPNVFRRMSSEALTNGLQLEGRLDEVLDLVSRTTNLLNDNGLVDFWADDFEFFPERLRTFTNAIRNDENLQTMTAYGDEFNAQDRERLARFQLAIRDYTPHQREVLVRELDRYAEANILQQINNLNPDDPEEGQRQYEEEHPGVADYLEQISRRRRGEDFTPEARAQTAMPVPRDIANQVVPMNQAFRDQTVQEVTEALNNSVRNLPEDRETLIEALQQYQRNPLDIPGSIEMILPTSPALGVQNENRRTISNYLIQQIQNRLGNQAPAQNAALGDNILRVINNNRDAVNAAYPEEISNNFGLVHNAAQSSAEAAIRRNAAQIGADENPNEAYINEVGRQLRNLSRGRRTEERVASIPVIQEFYDDLVRAQARDEMNQLVPEHIRGAITRDLNELMMLGRLNDSASILTGIFEGEGIFAELTTDEQRTAASDYLNATLRGLLNDPDYRPVGGERATPPDIFAGGEIIPPRPVAGNDPEAYRDFYTNRITGSRRAFDEVMQAERMTPGAINEAIARTDGRAMYDEQIQRFYNVDSPAGISQLNNALRRYMEDNGFDAPITPPARMIEEALTQAEYNYPITLVQELRDLINNIENEGDRFSTQPDVFIGHLRDESNEYANHNEYYSNAVNELADYLEQSMREYLQAPATAPQLPAPAANPIDELERRYGETPRAPIDIVSDGLNRSISQFARDYSAEVQNAYRQVLNEITPAPTLANLQEAMSHLSIIHDMLEGGDYDPGEFNLTTAREMTDLSNLLERHFEVFREFENLLDGLNDQPPQGRKRGGFIERATGVRSYSDLKRDAFNKKFYDDGQAALDFELRHGTKSDKLGIPYKKYPDYSEEDIIAPKRNEFLNFNQDLKRGGRVRRMSSGGVNKVRPTPNIPATPAKQNPNVTDYVPNKTVDPGFKETLERVTNKPLHPSVARGVAEGRIPLSDAQRLSDYANTPGSSKVGTGSSSMPDQSQKMENYLNRVKVGEVPNPYPAEQRQPISRDLTGKSDFTREQLREQALRDQTLNPRGGGVSGGGGNLTDAEMKNRLGSRNPTYNAGGKVSIDQMRYELLRK